MTYLHCPRLHFAGAFVADPSTVNNDYNHYEKPFDRDTEWVQTTNGTGGWWNPEGRHSFRFENVSVSSAVGPDGGPVTDDPVVGLWFVTRGLRPAKLVDLDPDQQMASTIFGLRVAIVDTTGGVLVEGVMEPAPFADIWRRSLVGGGDEAASAAYQSALEIVRWPEPSPSPLLQQLRDATGDGLLSIKFNVDGYSMNPASPGFTRGRVVGTVGPATADEPAHTVIGRQFGTEEIPLGLAFPSTRPQSGVNYFPGVVDTAARKVRLDLGNALPVATAGGAVDDIGVLVLACRADDDSVSEIASIDYRGTRWYETTAGIVDLPEDRQLTDEELGRVATGRLQLVALRNGQAEPVSEEAPVHVRADTFVARLDPSDEWVAHLYVTQRGQPVSGATVNLFLLLPGEPDAAANFPVGGLTFPDSVTTDARGVAEATFVAADPGNPRFFYFNDDPVRRHVDGQVYRVGYAVDGVVPRNPSNLLSVLVWNTFVPDDPPTWHGSMSTVLVQYANLYPWMTTSGPRLDLALYEQVAAQREDILRVLDLPVTEPGHMPVSRDLSGSRRAAMAAWLTNLGPDGKPLLGEERARREVPEAPAERRPVPDAELGGKSAAARRLSIGPR